MKGQGTRLDKKPRPAPPLLHCIKNAIEFRPQTRAEWHSCQDVLINTPTKTGNSATKSSSPTLILNNGESLQAPKSLEFGGTFVCLFVFYFHCLSFSLSLSVSLSLSLPLPLFIFIYPFLRFPALRDKELERK